MNRKCSMWWLFCIRWHVWQTEHWHHRPAMI
jgi:hypothetical protein